jgi:hypothetical protein
MFENCSEIRNHFSDYVDNLCSIEARKSIRYHLSFCGACEEQLEQLQSVQEELRSIPRRQVPSDLAQRLRIQATRRTAPKPPSERWLHIENALRPLLIPATGGVLTAIICFGLIMGSQGMPMSDTPDVAIQVVTPARVEALAPIDFNTGDSGLVLLTEINAEGRAKGYRVLSGQRSPEIMNQLDRLIYFSVFQPATNFGKPTDGEVVLSLRRITVRG